ncbi:hypothetical protein U1Q18_013696 [Sarracenia purpurea var. burkii]
MSRTIVPTLYGQQPFLTDGGQRLDHGQTWTINGTRARGGQIWARTSCSFDENGLGSCETGDCGGHLQCQTHGQPPHTFVEYVLTTQDYELDFFNISLVKGFNVPIQLIIPDPKYAFCAQGIGCTADITGQCPSELRVSGGCNDPCTLFKTDNYCCSESCGPTKFSRFFKQSCPDAVSYPRDYKVNTYTCVGATYYDIVFCP